jgi:hypothetical protein
LHYEKDYINAITTSEDLGWTVVDMKHTVTHRKKESYVIVVIDV